MAWHKFSSGIQSAAALDLQTSLLAKHEITRTLTLVGKITEGMNISESADPELNELGKDVRTEKSVGSD